VIKPEKFHDLVVRLHEFSHKLLKIVEKPRILIMLWINSRQPPYSDRYAWERFREMYETFQSTTEKVKVSDRNLNHLFDNVSW
jgi:hypothetical protein